jgi:hypothetical protein
MAPKSERAEAQVQFKFDRDSVISAVNHLTAIRDGGITELRVLDAVTDGDRRPHVESGYFSDPKALADSLRRIRQCKGAYIIPNPVDTRLLARASNRLRPAGKEPLTGDADILARMWLLLDFDPVRPTGISATDAEKQNALAVAKACREWLRDEAWPDPVLGDSGNGGHSLYAVSLPADDGGLIQRCIQAIADKFDSTLVTVDCTVFNASRIWKLPGTLSCKGDATEERPHRPANIIDLPSDLHMRLVTRDQLEALAALASDPPKDTPIENHGAFDLAQWIMKHRLDVEEPRPWQSTGRRWVFRTCPWNPAHTDRSAYIVQRPGGAIGAGCHHNSCAEKGWHDLRDSVEPGWRDRKQPSAAFAGSAGSNSTTEKAWPAPKQLPPDLPPVMQFDIDLLPEAFQPWIEDIAERTQAPIDFSAVAAMIALASVLGRKVTIRPKRHDDWTVVANLWGGPIGRPGVMKTTAINEPMKAIRRLDIDAKKRFASETREFNARKLVADAKRKENEAAIKKALKDGDEAAAELARKLAGDEPTKPIRRRYVVNDSSVEKLGEILRDNPNGVLVFRDELIGLLKSLDKDGQESARSFYLEAWNGDGSFIYDRITRGTVEIESTCISIIGSIQPGPLGEYMRAAMNLGKGDDGLVQRFQLLVWPDVSKDWVNVDRWPNTPAKNTAYRVFERLDGLDPDEVGAATDDHGNGLPYLRFSCDAQELFDEWRTQLEKSLRSEEEHPAMEAHLAKFRSLIPSLALLLHLADDGSGPVRLDALQRAIRWGRYLESHARRIFAPAALSSISGARALANKILAGEVAEEFSLRSIYNAGWSGLSTRDLVEDAVEVLCDCNWVREKVQKTDGRPKTTYQVNPLVVERGGGALTFEHRNEASRANQQNQQNLQKHPFAGFEGFAGSQDTPCATEAEVAIWTS